MLRAATYRAVLGLSMVLVLILGPSAPLTAEDFIRGDVNDDGHVSIADLVRLISHVLMMGEQPICYDSADIDDDGQVALNDAIVLVSFLFGPTGAAPLPAPYPDPGQDPTADALSPCNVPTGEPVGAELPHVFCFSSVASDNEGFALAAGQGPVWIPIKVSSEMPFEGMTISISYDPNQLDSLVLDFTEGAPYDYGADLRISQISPNYPGRVYGYVVMEMLPPITTTAIPFGADLLVGHIIIEPNADLPMGSQIEISFETLPPSGDEPPIRNELVWGGAGTIYPTTHPLTATVVAASEIFIRGDTNRDGAVDITDGLTLLQYLFLGQGVSVPCLDACDVDDNGAVNLADALRVLYTLFEPSQTAPPAHPYPYQGIDRTPNDNLPCE